MNRLYEKSLGTLWSHRLRLKIGAFHSKVFVLLFKVLTQVAYFDSYFCSKNQFNELNATKIFIAANTP